MRSALLILFVAISAGAMAQRSVVPLACGPSEVRFDVELDNTQHAALPVEPGKARIYFIEDLGTEGPTGVVGSYVTKIGMDGAWIGAIRAKSWFSIAVEPGVHHLCTNSQTHMFGPVVELAHFTAEAGQAYYFRIRNFMWQTRRLEFGPTDSDQALYVITSFPLSVSHPAK